MSEMNLIMEGWRSYICESEIVDKLEKQPEQTSSLIDKIKNKEIDANQLKQIVILLAKDPEVQKTAQFFKDSLEGDVQAEGLLDKIGAHAVVKIGSLQDAMNASPIGKKIINNPSTTLALGFLLFTASLSGLDVSMLSDPETIQTAMDILKKGKNIKFEDVIGAGIEAIEEMLAFKEEKR